MTQGIETQSATQTITIKVVYNGVTKPIDAHPQETVQAALEKALNAFSIHNQRHIMAFYREDGSEVTPENQSLQAAGIVSGTELALRPSRVKGGRR